MLPALKIQTAPHLCAVGFQGNQCILGANTPDAQPQNQLTILCGKLLSGVFVNENMKNKTKICRTIILVAAGFLLAPIFLRADVVSQQTARTSPAWLRDGVIYEIFHEIFPLPEISMPSRSGWMNCTIWASRSCG